VVALETRENVINRQIMNHYHHLERVREEARDIWNELDAVRQELRCKRTEKQLRERHMRQDVEDKIDAEFKKEAKKRAREQERRGIWLGGRSEDEADRLEDRGIGRVRGAYLPSQFPGQGLRYKKRPSHAPAPPVHAMPQRPSVLPLQSPLPQQPSIPLMSQSSMAPRRVLSTSTRVRPNSVEMGPIADALASLSSRRTDDRAQDSLVNSFESASLDP